MTDIRPIFEMRGVRLLNVPCAHDLAVECIELDCYQLRALEGKWNVLDVGACYGEFGLYAASLGHNVVMVEPSALSFEVLLKNSSMSAISESQSVRSEMAAVGAVKHPENLDTLHKYRPDHPAGSGAVKTDGNIEIVHVVHIKDLISSALKHSDRKTLLKLDCEGAEVEIFDRIDEWVHLVDAVSMETHNHDAGKLGAMLSERGFKVELSGTCPFPFPKWDESMAGGLVIARR